MSNKPTYKIQQIGVQEFDVLIPLMKDCFGLDINTDFFRWKYQQNPSGEFIGFIAVSEQGEIGAYYGVIPELYVVEGKETVIYQSCDTMTHSAHRRRGLFQLLANHCYDYLRQQRKLFIIGFGGAMSTPGFIKFGWKEVTTVQQVFYPRAFAVVHFAGNDKRYKIEQVVDVTPLEHLLKKSNSHTLIHSLKNATTFGWRIKNPLNEYKLYAATDDNGKAAGYICYYESRGKIYLFDFYFTDKAAEKQLLGKVKKELKEKQLKGIQVLCGRNSYLFAILAANGFISSPFKKWPERLSQPIIFYSTEENMQRYNSPAVWNFTPFDHDTL